ncbi:iron complex transport system permease protein [Desulfacinum hydrothermale DSM 13146]|uniref:Iron complex transport system permease protein n=1 Tax=Desulfacinum hydrothermale DSM 13146 TaxID=1121390 RepID=A0A1W1XY21_9BACT|nr:iron ABC transporter permease [Desulfacinum hydrothermale]SMC28747.1 iron complex transport system permease protein [Desulfacinum hydrothermale DSM 13146]
MASGLAGEFVERGRKTQRFFASVAFVTLLLGMIALGFGSYGLSLAKLFSGLLGQSDGVGSVILWNIRLPRIAAALSVGGGLGLSGLLIQALLRNPLGSPSTLGISQGAAFGASLAIIAWEGRFFPVTASAFAGALGATILIVFFGRLRDLSPEAIILAGVALASLFGAATVLLHYLADETQLAMAVVWSFGDVARSGWQEIAMVTVSTGILGLASVSWRWHLNALDSGAESAKSLGVSVERLRWQGLVLAALVSALATAFHGVIAFVGLIAPHAARRLVGADHRFLVPMSGLLGALLLLSADTFSRLILGSGSFPVGVVTSFLGAPLFLYLLMRGRS